MFAFPSPNISLLRLVLLTIALLAVTSTTRALPVQTEALETRAPRCPSVEDIEKYISKKSGGAIQNAVFWSFPGGSKDAEKIARERSGHYFYDYVSDAELIMWKENCSPAERNALPARASYALAKLSVGTAFVVTANPGLNSIWSTIEFPVLKGNRKINTVFSVDPKTRRYTQIFALHPGDWNAPPQLPAPP